MKESNKTERWIITIIMLLVMVVILAGSLLPYFEIDFSGGITLLPEEIADIINEMTELMGSTKGKISFTAAALLRSAAGMTRDTTAADIMHFIGLAILVPYVAVIFAVAFSLTRRLWGYIVSAVFSLGGAIVSLQTVFWTIPAFIYKTIPASLLDLEALIPFNFNEKFLRKQVINGIGVSWWICVAGSIVLLGISVAGIFISQKKKGWRLEEEPECADFIFLPAEKKSVGQIKKEEMETTAGISCGFGELNGVEIPLTNGETITIGTNSSRCNLVVAESGIEGVHCRILYSREKGCYQVQDLSQSGVYINDRRMASQNAVWLSPGTILFLSNKYAIGLL